MMVRNDYDVQAQQRRAATEISQHASHTCAEGLVVVMQALRNLVLKFLCLRVYA